MSEEIYAEGEVVENVSTQRNETGEIISRVTVELFGFSNADANEMSLSLVNGIAGVCDHWRTVKVEEATPKKGKA